MENDLSVHNVVMGIRFREVLGAMVFLFAGICEKQHEITDASVT